MLLPGKKVGCSLQGLPWSCRASLCSAAAVCFSTWTVDSVSDSGGGLSALASPCSVSSVPPGQGSHARYPPRPRPASYVQSRHHILECGESRWNLKFPWVFCAQRDIPNAVFILLNVQCINLQTINLHLNIQTPVTQ